MDRFKLRFLLTIFTLLISVPCYAGGVMMMGCGVPAVADCMAGSYILAWNGDYPSDTDKICRSGGTIDGTVNGSLDVGTSYGESGSVGMKFNAASEYIGYSQTANQYVNATSDQTIYVRVYLSANPTGTNEMIMFRYDGTNYISIYLSGGRVPVGIYRADTGGVQDVTGGAGTVTAGVWSTIGYSWQKSTGNHSTYAGSWGTAADELDSSTMAGGIGTLRVGSTASYNMGAGEYIQIDKWVVLDGYQAGLPAGW